MKSQIEQVMLLKNLLKRWLQINEYHFNNDLKDLENLVQATQQVLTLPPLPIVVIQLSSGKIQSVYSNLSGIDLRIFDYDTTPEAVADTRGLVPVLEPR